MNPTPAETPPKKRRAGLFLIRAGILVFAAWAIFMGWQLAQVARTPQPNAAVGAARP